MHVLEVLVNFRINRARLCYIGLLAQVSAVTYLFAGVHAPRAFPHTYENIMLTMWLLGLMLGAASAVVTMFLVWLWYELEG